MFCALRSTCLLSRAGNTLDLMVGEKTVENRRLQLLICQGYVEQAWKKARRAQLNWEAGKGSGCGLFKLA